MDIKDVFGASGAQTERQRDSKVNPTPGKSNQQSMPLDDETLKNQIDDIVKR